FWISSSGGPLPYTVHPPRVSLSLPDVLRRLLPIRALATEQRVRHPSRFASSLYLSEHRRVRGAATGGAELLRVALACPRDRHESRVLARRAPIVHRCWSPPHHVTRTNRSRCSSRVSSHSNQMRHAASH